MWVSERLLARRAAADPSISGDRWMAMRERSSPADGGLRDVVKNAFADRSYYSCTRLSHLWFFTLRFGDSFTRGSGPLWLAGLSVQAGHWRSRTSQYRRKFHRRLAARPLSRQRTCCFGMYGSRTMLILFICLAPKDRVDLLLIGGRSGFSCLGTAPPTAGVVASCSARVYLASFMVDDGVGHKSGRLFRRVAGCVAFTNLAITWWMWYAECICLP